MKVFQDEYGTLYQEIDTSYSGWVDASWDDWADDFVLYRGGSKVAGFRRKLNLENMLLDMSMDRMDSVLQKFSLRENDVMNIRGFWNPTIRSSD